MSALGRMAVTLHRVKLQNKLSDLSATQIMSQQDDQRGTQCEGFLTSKIFINLNLIEVYSPHLDMCQ